MYTYFINLKDAFKNKDIRSNIIGKYCNMQENLPLLTSLINFFLFTYD